MSNGINLKAHEYSVENDKSFTARPQLKHEEVMDDLRWAIIKVINYANNKGNTAVLKECDRISEKYKLMVY